MALHAVLVVVLVVALVVDLVVAAVLMVRVDLVIAAALIVDLDVVVVGGGGGVNFVVLVVDLNVVISAHVVEQHALKFLFRGSPVHVDKEVANRLYPRGRL